MRGRAGRREPTTSLGLSARWAIRSLPHEVEISPDRSRNTCRSSSGSNTLCASEKLPRLRSEFAGLRIDNNEAAELPVVEQEVEVEILVADFHVNLATDEGEAYAEIEEEFLDVGKP